MKAKHDWEGGGRQHLLVVIVVQAVSSCQGKSVSNLGGGVKFFYEITFLYQKISLFWRGVDQETAEMQNKHNHFTLGFLIFVVGGLDVANKVSI